MDDDVINVVMWPVGYSPSTETGEVAGQVMTKSGSGEPVNEKMYPDYESIEYLLDWSQWRGCALC